MRFTFMRAAPAVTWLGTGLLLFGCTSRAPAAREVERPARTPVPALDAAPGADVARVEDEPALDPAAPMEGVLGWVAGEPVAVSELVAEWHAVAPKELWLVLEKVVAARLARAEAQRFGLRLAPEAVHLRVEAERRRLGELMVERGTTLEEFARRERGMDPAAFLRTVEAAVSRQMLVERVVRAWVLTNEWVRLRVVLVRTREELDVVLSRLAAGADFAELAREVSVDATAAAGGLLPFLVREESSALARHAFQLEPGETSRGFEHLGFHVLLRLEARHAPLARREWSAIGRAVETSLGEHPIGDTEFSHWKLTMEQRYPIDVEPLRTALGLGGAD